MPAAYRILSNYDEMLGRELVKCVLCFPVLNYDIPIRQNVIRSKQPHPIENTETLLISANDFYFLPVIKLFFKFFMLRC